MKNKITERRRISRRRRFTEGAAHHIYQRTVGGFNLFYDIEDYLVYFTIFFVLFSIFLISSFGIIAFQMRLWQIKQKTLTNSQKYGIIVYNNTIVLYFNYEMEE